ncbi:hypothetical protein OG943_27870 [Amycolatopsis sp. NBC_00345]|uniref:hypothetical protein n=1 Tax=Amycolatopsis sp. NBC_00345 TaxID=2975955 RepID=UPI002E26084C
MPVPSRIRDSCRPFLAEGDVLPRTTELGPVDVHPSLGPTVSFGGLVLEIDEEYVPAIRAADLERGGVGLPDDPLPGL